jgi:hypothetical protein
VGNQHRIGGIMKTPPRISRGPRGLVSIWNALRDFVVARDIEPGDGLVVDETTQGRVMKLAPDLIAAINSPGRVTTGTPPGSGPGATDPNPDADDGGTGDGTGLPDVETDEDGNPTYNGQPLDWQTLNVCVDDGAGGYTPMVMNVYGTAPS